MAIKYAFGRVRPVAPVIFGMAATELTADERAFFKSVRPLGYILFARNVTQKRSQISSLVDSLREISGDNCPILIDQEGGRVQRIKMDGIPAYPPMEVFGQTWASDKQTAYRQVKENFIRIAADLYDFGINVNCAPVLDVRYPQTHQAIGNRCFSTDPVCVADLGQAAIDGLLQQSVTPVIKHLPGHGRATTDSHHELPRVTATRQDLRDTDFYPFKKIAAGAQHDKMWGMTSHILFPDIDADNCATFSKKVIDEVIRGDIGFKGVLVTDDLDMKALSGSYAEKATKALAAGCDLVLHCNGNFSAMQEIAACLPNLSESLAQTLARAGFPIEC